VSTRTSDKWQSRTNPNGPWNDDWERTKDRYWSNPFTRHRCFWHQRFWLGKPLSYAQRQLNHLTYRRGGSPHVWQVKPMCRTCHKIETGLARFLRVLGVKRHPHYVATYGVRWLITLAIFTPIWYPLVFIFHVVP
jgi:hypothetical protein